jgi:hypothetical protein
VPDNRWKRSKGFDMTASDDVAAGAQEVCLLSVKVPATTNLRITHFGNVIDLGSEWGLITWSLRVNGVPDETLGAVLDQIGSISAPRELGRNPIARGGDVLEVYASSASAEICATGVTLKGEYGKEY